MDQIGPSFDARPVFAAERAELLALLETLGVSDWSRATICPGWSVQDVAVHLLHDDVRRLSRSRDGKDSEGFAVGGRLPDSLNAANEAWTSAAAFLSPVLVVDLLRHTSAQISRFWASRDLTAPSEGVWWAGVELAPVWLDLARDYSEDWTHQQQIRDAVGRPGGTDASFLDPAVDTFLRALPHVYRDVVAGPGATVRIEIEIDNSGRTVTRTLRADVAGWFLTLELNDAPTANVAMRADTFWRLATGGMSPGQAREGVVLSGDPELAEPALGVVSVVR